MNKAVWTKIETCESDRFFSDCFLQAAEIVGMPTNTIHQTFPSELTMWIDPLEVSYRIGENGSICILYEYKENQQGGTGPGNAPQPWRPAPVPTTSRSKTSSPTTLKSSTRSTATSQQVSRRVNPTMQISNLADFYVYSPAVVSIVPFQM